MPNLEVLKTSPIDVYHEYLALGEDFEVPPKVRLELTTQSVGEDEDIDLNGISVSTAVQCYAPGDAKMTSRTKDWEKNVARNTLNAGHHTTRMHTYLTFRVEASRNVVHDVFHAYPYYNSEQQSQRYVEAREGFYIVRNLPETQRGHFVDSANFMNQAYFEMLEPIRLEALRRLAIISPKAYSNEKNRKRLEDKAVKLSQEVARYVLPIGQKTKMFHTVSHLQLIRLFAAAESSQFSDEAKYTIAKMIEQVVERYPNFLEELPTQVAPSADIFEGGDNQQEMVRNMFGQIHQGTHLINHTYEPEVLRQMIGATGNVEISEVLERLFNPRLNATVVDLFDTGIHHPYSSVLQQIYISFVTKLSHTANSQRQRHRTTLGTIPQISRDYNGADFITPMLVREDLAINEAYEQTMLQIYANYERALEMGIDSSTAQYLLPNAHALYVHEGGNLFNWSHRIRQRLCLLAQEEIFFITVEQAKAIVDVIPGIEQIMLAPCGLRRIAGQGPFCPEGDRYCGQPVYNWVPGEKFPDPLDEYINQRLV